MTRGSRSALLCGVGLALALPGAAQAATKTVTLGPTRAGESALNKLGSDVNAFFPATISVHVGDSVRFVPTNFHTVHFFGKKGKLAAVIAPTGKTVTGVNDAAGVPFGFNGAPELGLNPALFGGGKLGKTVVTNGTQEIESGAPISDKPKPMTVRFTKAGLFTYHCDIHPGMNGRVRVVAGSKSVPSAAADAKRTKAQLAAGLKTAKGFAKATSPANTVTVGLAGAGGTTLFDYVPSKLTVPVGTPVTFRMLSPNKEVHTVTTGPGDPENDPKSYLGAIAASFNSPTPDQKALFPSDPGAPVGITPTLHGNGFWNTGVLDALSATPLPATSQATFAAAGTYEFHCMIHPFMHLTITAT